MKNTIDFIDDEKIKELEKQEVLENEVSLDEELDEELEKAYNATSEFNEEIDLVEKEVEEEIESKDFEEDVDESEMEYISGKSSFSMYINSLSSCKPIGKEEEEELFRRLKNGDESVKKDIFVANARLVPFVIQKKFYWLSKESVSMAPEDLVGVGNLGLLKAISMFDSNKKVRFSTYAFNWIYSYVERYIMNNSSFIRIPVHMQEKTWKIKKLLGNKEKELGRILTCEEEKEIIESVLGKGCNAVQKYNECLVLTDMVSLNAPIRNGEEGDDSEFGDFIEGKTFIPELEHEKNNLRTEMEEIMNDCLPERSVDILRKRFGFETGRHMTLEEIAKCYGVTRERIRQIESESIRILKRNRKCRYLKEYFSTL